MNIFLKIIFVLSSVILLNGCFSLRSAEGLSEGELNVNYIVPLAFSARYGITDNVETRLMQIGEATTYDIFLHTNNKENASNYGIYLGGLWNYEKKFCSSWFNSGFVYSKKINKYFIPYISINLTYDGEIKRIDYTASYPALGADIKIPLSERLSILLTPELGYVFKYQKGGYPLNDAVNHRSSMNIGLIFDLY